MISDINESHSCFKPLEISEKTGAFPHGRSGHSMCCDESNIYIYGGYSPRTDTEDDNSICPRVFVEIWQYNIATATWVRLLSEEIPDTCASSCLKAISKRLWIYGGTGYPFGEKRSNTIKICDFSKVDATGAGCKWNLLEPSPTSHNSYGTGDNLPPMAYGQSLVIHNSKVYIFGGAVGLYDPPTNDVHVLDLETRSWEKLYPSGDVPNGRYKQETAQDEQRHIIGYVFTVICTTMSTCFVTTAHSHPADKAMVEAAKIKATLKSKATLSRTKAAHLLADTLVDAPTDVRVALGNKESVKRTIRNSQNKSYPPEPKTIGEFLIEGEWCLTEGNEKKQFLIHDSGVDSSNRVVVFATKDCLQHLSNSNTWLMDGTFSASPNIFTQVYVIRAPIGETVITCVYALIRNKQQSSYEELLSAVLNKSEEYGFFLDPQVIITDFEQAVLNAVYVTFRESVRRQGCFYHLTQSTLRKIQSLGLVTLYKENDNIKHWCGMLDGIAFLPLEDIASGIHWIKGNCPEELIDLVSYFDATYISGSYRKVITKDNCDNGIPVVKMRRLPPLFPPPIWNVNKATLNDEARTNNLCEGWNYGFQQLLGHNHPSIWNAIKLAGRMWRGPGIVSDRFYIFGGGRLHFSESLVKIYAYSFKENTWDSIVCTEDPVYGAPEPRSSFGLVQHRQEVYVFGGQFYSPVVERTSMDNIWKISIGTWQWQKLDIVLPIPVYFHTVTLSPVGYVYLFGGVNVEGTRINDLHRWRLPGIVLKLSEICWELICRMTEPECLSKSCLRELGVPRHFCDRLL